MNIYQSINAIMDECPAIAKKQRNEQQKFMYRGVDVVMNVFQPLLAKYKVFVVPEVLDTIREERLSKSGGNIIYTILKVKYTFFAEDGSFICATVQGEGMDSADKSANKAMSVAFKYAMFQVFCIPTEEMRDPDAESFEESKPVSRPTKDTMAEANLIRTQILALADLDTICKFVTDLTKGKFKSLDGMNLEQLRFVKTSFLKSKNESK